MGKKKKSAQVEALLWEARVRRLALKRLQTPLKLARAAMKKDEAEAMAVRQKLAGYSSYEEAHEAYGWGFITEDELDTVSDILSGKTEQKGLRPESAAVYDILVEFASRLADEARGFEWEDLPPEERARIKAQSDALHKRAQGVSCEADDSEAVACSAR